MTRARRDNTESVRPSSTAGTKGVFVSSGLVEAGDRTVALHDADKAVMGGNTTRKCLASGINIFRYERRASPSCPIAARAGDREGLDLLLRRYLPRLSRWARGRLPAHARDLLDTDDLVQDALVRTIRSVEQFDERWKGAFHCYLRKAVLNNIRNQVRRVEPRDRAYGEAVPPAGPGPSPLEELIGRESLERYERAQRRDRSARSGHSHSRGKPGLARGRGAGVRGEGPSSSRRRPKGSGARRHRTGARHRRGTPPAAWRRRPVACPLPRGVSRILRRAHRLARRGGRSGARSPVRGAGASARLQRPPRLRARRSSRGGLARGAVHTRGTGTPRPSPRGPRPPSDDPALGQHAGLSRAGTCAARGSGTGAR